MFEFILLFIFFYYVFNSFSKRKAKRKPRTPDAELKGYKKELKEDPISAEIKADELIRNTYRTLMSRGMKGCYVYFVDEATSNYFKSKLPK